MGIFNEIIHGIQYYRAPTPKKEEWETDIAKLESFGLDVFQIRINWRQNEREEGVYNFDDVDALMDLAEKYHRKVIIKFLLECAPQYVFDKYGGSIIGPKGEVLRGGSHGAFYTGGWWPCFVNPEVKKAAIRFVEKVAERYADRKNLILWNAWNEPRNRSTYECFCPHCRKAFGQYLKNKFGTIEKLNEFYGVSEESFEHIALPVSAHGYWDVFEFKKWRSGQVLYENLKFVCDAVRKYDKTRPVMSHVGQAGAFQDDLLSRCDDRLVSKAVDFYGTSIPFSSDMSVEANRFDMQLLTSFLYSVDKNYFVHEIYPGLGFFKEYDTDESMEFKLYTSLAGGAKGLVYWQYRAERVGMENDCAGIADIDGTPRQVAYAIGKFGDELHKNMQYFVGAEPEQADIALIFDDDNNLMSSIEDSCGAYYDFNWASPLFYYKKSYIGAFRLLRKLDYKVDCVMAADTDKFNKYKVLWFPYYCIIDKAVSTALAEFVKNGGIVIAEEGFGLRTKNTWLQPYDIDCKPVLSAKLKKRRFANGADNIVFGEDKANVYVYRSDYAVENGNAVAKFTDESPALWCSPYGKGKIFLSGASIGYGYFQDASEVWERLAESMVSGVNAARYVYSDVKNGFYQNNLVKKGYRILFFMNWNEKKKAVHFTNKVITSGGKCILDGGMLTVAPFGCGYVVIDAK